MSDGYLDLARRSAEQAYYTKGLLDDIDRVLASADFKARYQRTDALQRESDDLQRCRHRPVVGCQHGEQRHKLPATAALLGLCVAGLYLLLHGIHQAVHFVGNLPHRRSVERPGRRP